METLAQDENILNVTLIEPRQKHPSIFRKFDELAPGKYFIIHNDHDPRPLYYELMAERGNIFSWEYLEEGPLVWRVKIAKKEQAENKDAHILDATLLSPMVKHATIFKTFDELQPGDYFILHNDHDPVPLRFQLENTRGNIFTWEYLEQGPELWRVKIARKGAPAKEKEADATDKNILLVTAIEPRLKHPTIFAHFDKLQPGENLTIHNDHDPKPLYYQLLGERGNIFTWEYLEQGPDLWKVKISRKAAGEKEETLGEIAAKDLRKAEVFKKYGLDFCCGGKKTVKEACAEKGIDITQVEQDLREPQHTVQEARPLPFNEWNLSFLADYIVNTHHYYVRKTIPDIRNYAAKVASVHGGHHPELLRINELVAEVCEEMDEHMIKEEKVLFPYIKQLATAVRGSAASLPSIASPIRQMETEHESVGNNMHEIRKISNNYELPDDACASYSFLFKTLDEFENDLHTHVHLENNILFPKALKLEEDEKKSGHC